GDLEGGDPRSDALADEGMAKRVGLAVVEPCGGECGFPFVPAPVVQVQMAAAQARVEQRRVDPGGEGVDRVEHALPKRNYARHGARRFAPLGNAAPAIDAA